MEYSWLFLKKLKIIRYQVWNFPKFQTWNRIFFWFCKKSCECSKINEIYLLWISSEPIFSKIQRETFEVEIFPIFSISNFFFFAELQELEHSAEGTFFRKIGNFSTFPIFSKIPNIYFFGPTSVPSLSKIKEPFWITHYHSLRSFFV